MGIVVPRCGRTPAGSPARQHPNSSTRLASPARCHPRGVSYLASPTWCHAPRITPVPSAGWLYLHDITHVPSPTCRHPCSITPVPSHQCHPARGITPVPPPMRHHPHDIPSWQHPCAITHAAAPCASARAGGDTTSPLWGPLAVGRVHPGGQGGTHRVEGFLEDEEGPREANDEQGLGAEDAEEDALHAGGDEQLRHPHHTLGLLTWRGAEPVGAGGGRTALCPPIPHSSAPRFGGAITTPRSIPRGWCCRRWHPAPPAPCPAGGCPRPSVCPQPVPSITQQASKGDSR